MYHESVTSALVLSAGGMFGAYQAGVWRFLADRFRPDMVVGTSVGSLNGWAIAGGISPADLAEVWRDPRLGAIMRMSRRAAAGIYDPGPLAGVVRELANRYTPRVPFALTLVQVPRLRLRLLRTPEITWQHLLASCAVPAAYPPVTIGGVRYVDGGLLGALPLWAAVELGAERVVAVDVLPKLPSRILHAGMRLVQRFAPAAPAREPAEIVRIGRSEPLGTLRESLHWTRANVDRWMDWGAADAEKCFRLE